MHKTTEEPRMVSYRTAMHNEIIDGIAVVFKLTLAILALVAAFGAWVAYDRINNPRIITFVREAADEHVVLTEQLRWDGLWSLEIKISDQKEGTVLTGWVNRWYENDRESLSVKLDRVALVTGHADGFKTTEVKVGMNPNKIPYFTPVSTEDPSVEKTDSFPQHHEKLLEAFALTYKKEYQRD